MPLDLRAESVGLASKIKMPPTEAAVKVIPTAPQSVTVEQKPPAAPASGPPSMLERLKEQLDLAIAHEEFQEAARLRDIIRALEAASKDAAP